MWRCGWRRLVLLSLLLLALAAAWAGVRLVRIHHAVAAMEARGAGVVIEYRLQFEDSVLLRWYSLLTGDSRMQIVWSGPKVGDEDLKSLARLSNIYDLQLEDTRVTDAGLECLRTCTELQVLSLKNTGIGDAGLEKLRAVNTFASVGLGEYPRHRRGHGAFGLLAQMQLLDLADTAVTDRGVEVVRRFPQLVARIWPTPT